MYRILNYTEIERTFDKIKMSEIKEDDNVELLYLRFKVDENQKKMEISLQVIISSNKITQRTVNQSFV